MFFRFGSTVVIVVLISLAGIAIEKQNLSLRRELSRQRYRTDVLLEEHARLRLQTQQMGAPNRMIDALENGKLEIRQPEKSTQSSPRRIPLLQWRRNAPFSP